ncbi:MAG: hypothetical protein JW760_02935 [Spirochaetales bacterium]|nr:hypothetical protein [Spirochaetales bacterium]
MTASHPERTLVYLGILCTFLFHACGGAGLSETEDEPIPSHRWYLLEEGLPVSLDEEALLPLLKDPVPEIPWTSQVRPAGFLQVKDRVFAGINRYGLLELREDPEAGVGYNAYFDRTLFDHRTLGALLLLEGHPVVHVYVNQILGLDDPLKDKENLYFLTEDRYEAFPLGGIFESGQLTDILPKKQEWFLAWRGTGSLRGRVEYEKRASLGMPGEAISPGTFRQGYPFLPLEEGPALYQKVYELLKKHYAPTRVVLQITEKDASGAEEYRGIRYFRAGQLETVQEKDAVFFVFEAVRDRERCYVLFGEENKIFYGDAGGMAVLNLPKICERLQFYGLWPLGDSLVVSWEQRDFVFTGRSGFLYLRVPAFSQAESADNPEGM